MYIRVKDSSGKVHVTLLGAKSRVAPIKEITIPRLELSATKLLVDFILSTLPAFNSNQIEAIHCWSDSQISLYWIHGAGQKDEKLRMFVANRVNDVMQKTEKLNCQWHWVSGKENPADLASRGVFPNELTGSNLWFKGPDWLTSNHWPNMEKTFQISEEERELIKKEVTKKKEKIQATPIVAMVIHHAQIMKSSEVLSRGPWFQSKKPGNKSFEFIESFSDFKKLKLATAMLLRACNNFKNPRNKTIGSITSEEKKNAVNWLIQYDQANTVSEEIQTLRGKKGSHLTFKFDDNEKILRVVGRLENANLTRVEKNPIYLAPEGKLIKLIISYAHKRSFHGGTQDMTQFIRSKFWVPGLRRLVKQIPLRCPPCFRQRMKLSTQQMASLPASRVNPAYPFENCGVDYAGPVLV